MVSEPARMVVSPGNESHSVAALGHDAASTEGVLPEGYGGLQRRAKQGTCSTITVGGLRDVKRIPRDDGYGGPDEG